MQRGWFLEVGIWLLLVLLLIPAAAVGYVIGHSSKQKTKTVIQTPAMASRSLITPAPAFSTGDLSKTAGDDWITNGGSTFNQRFSSLDEIDTSNVSQLRGVWLTHLRKSAEAAKYSAESQPIEYKGVIYVPTGEDDVFAVDASSGDILWQHQANLDQTISTVCCGWESRGVAIGDGRVFIGQLDGKLVALDQKTGQVAWQTRVGQWEKGVTITGAPLYYDGLVITGISGGEFGIRGRVTAYDATTGKERWRVYTIPRPGPGGHDTGPPHPNGRPHRRPPPARARSVTTRGPPTRRSGSTAAPPCGRRLPSIPSLGCCTSRPATPRTTSTAASAPARTSSPRRWSRWMRRPASTSGTSRWSTT